MGWLIMELIGDLKQSYTANQVQVLKNKTATWFKKFLKIYQTKDVTPYMHALYAHVPQFLQLYSNITLILHITLGKEWRNIMTGLLKTILGPPITEVLMP